ncbi:MAG: penicillin acylase family protein [Desulfobacterales bacterium]|nr:penicillin acylase family protein [Desulfobacterales bacterium]
MKKNALMLYGFVLLSWVLIGSHQCYASGNHWGNYPGEHPGKHRDHYCADIRWTSYGIPHILAKSLPDASFGSGYALAKLNACVLADQLLMVRSERSRYFGPDKVSGSGDRMNLISDLFYKAMAVQDLAQASYHQQTKENRAILDAYIAGYNKYLRETGPEGLPCADQPGALDWATPASIYDFMAYLVDFTWLGGPKPLMPYIVAAQPPAETASLGRLSAPTTHDYRKLMAGAVAGASNGWAIGRDRTANKTGMLLGNPHYPWEGERRFFESQVTVPGNINYYGATLIGMPTPGIGFNEKVAWTHTVCTSKHFTYYRLALKPGDPTTYIYDGKERPMLRRQVTVQVLQPDGTLAPVTMTFYRSHFGPMLEIPGMLDWTATSAWTIRSATDEDQGVAMRWAMARAKNMADLKKVFARYQSVNYLNTIAVDSAGKAFYADTGNVPNVTQEMLDAGCALNGPQYLDGSRSACEWADDPAAAQTGIVPFKYAPQLTTTTYVANSNNSYWLANPETPIAMTALNQLWGTERTDIGLRPRMGLTLLEEVAGPGMRVNWETFKGLLFNDRVMGAELLADDLAALCRTDSKLEAIGVCDALADWDKTYRLDSTGGHIFREFMSYYRSHYAYTSLWAVPFDPADPVTTPNTLNIDGSEANILTALRQGVARLQAAGLDLDAPLGEIQFTRKGDEVIPIHGGPDQDGAFNMLYYNATSNGTLLPPDVSLGGLPSASLIDQGGYLINYGSSYMQLVEYTKWGRPRAKVLISYSQSTDPDSPHFSDQTFLFSQSRWRDCLFSEAQIASDPNLIIETVKE